MQCSAWVNNGCRDTVAIRFVLSKTQTLLTTPLPASGRDTDPTTTYVYIVWMSRFCKSHIRYDICMCTGMCVVPSDDMGSYACIRAYMVYLSPYICMHSPGKNVVWPCQRFLEAAAMMAKTKMEQTVCHRRIQTDYLSYFQVYGCFRDSSLYRTTNIQDGS